MGSILHQPDGCLQLHVEAGPHRSARADLQVHAVPVEVLFREGVARGGGDRLDVRP